MARPLLLFFVLSFSFCPRSTLICRFSFPLPFLFPQNRMKNSLRVTLGSAQITCVRAKTCSPWVSTINPAKLTCTSTAPDAVVSSPLGPPGTPVSFFVYDYSPP